MSQHERNTAIARGYWGAARNGLAVVGLFATISMSLGVVVPAPRGEAAVPLPDTVLVEEPNAFESNPLARVAARPADARERPLAKFIARNYRIAAQAAEQVVAASFEAARSVAIDPLLILAVMAVESRFNPIAESEMGAKGLMQIIPRFHLEKFSRVGGEESILDPDVNILVGAQILKEYIQRAGGLEDGLQWYNGASTDPARQYAERVLGEYDVIARVIGKARPPRSAPKAPATAEAPSAPVEAIPAPTAIQDIATPAAT